MKDDEERETHESYGLVRFSRCEGNPGRLFGSSLKDHGSYVSLSLRKAEVIHSLGRDRYYGSMHGDLIEVSLSSAQFAELLTTMNVGSGVPCTIRYFNGKRLEGPPERPLEVQKVKDSFQRDMSNLVAEAKQVVKDVEALLEKNSLTKADRRAILEKVGHVMMCVEHNTPFMLDQFEKASEKVVTTAKAEIDAFVTHNIVSEGLKAILAKSHDSEISALPEHKDP